MTARRRIGLTVIAVILLTSVWPPSRPWAEEDRSGLVWMSGEEIRSEFSGKKLSGLYPSQKPWDEAINSDGSTDYTEGARRWHGSWWVQNREFCFSYPPAGLIGGCFRITRISTNCFELYEFGTTKGLPTPGQSNDPPNIADQWNGRMWHQDRPTTCEARPSV